MRQDLWTAAQAAEFLGWSAEHVRRRARAGTIPVLRWGGRWAFEPDMLKAWIAAGSPEDPRMVRAQA